ncbi:MAG: hypothetical protein KDB40_01280 [Acidimicrobiales bacterium]|nr:hypothetical protein [Acidimicrobiales bacterium]MCB9393167.1 hypothetical protein [Acidimicrobiaceae bacterium]
MRTIDDRLRALGDALLRDSTPITLDEVRQGGAPLLGVPELDDVTPVDVSPSSTSRAPRRWVWLVGAAAAMVGVILTATWATGPDRLVPAPVATEPDRPSGPTSPSTPASAPASTPASTSLPVTSTIPIDRRRPMAIGESVMLGAGDELELGGFVVDVDEPRQGPETADLIEALAAAGEIGRTVVVQVGTNGPVTEDVYRRIAQALVGSEQVVFLTLHADRSWIGANNDIIRSLPAQYPNVSLLDWDELVASGAVSGIAADGIHLATSEAQQSYANAVFTAVGRDDLVRATRVSGLVVTVADDRPTVVDVRDANGLLGSFDLGCPTARTCTIESARVVGDTIWIAITDREGEGTTDDVGSRVVSAVTTSGEIVEHVRISGTTTIVRSAGLGANGILYAYVSDQAADRQLVAIEGGTVTTLATDVSGFLLSEDGRFLAVSFSNPPAGEQPRIEVTDLVDGTTNWFTTEGINAGPGAWSPDGRHLIVNDQWEDGTAWVVDPWSASARPTAAGEFLDGACFVDARTIAHRTWNVGYGQGDAQTGVIRLIDVDGGPPLAELGTDLFGDALGCHPDGSITYLQRPVVEVDLGGGLSQPEPDHDAPVDLVHIEPDGTSTTITSGGLRMI